MPKSEKSSELQAQQVELKELAPITSGELSNTIHRECEFCGKIMALSPTRNEIHEFLNSEFYCDTCLRNRFYTKHNRHILVLTFRALFAYYYYAFYRGTNRTVHYTEILEYINTHSKIGLRNPVFYYDPQSLLWFVDFSRVGKGKSKLPLEEVLKTVANILACLNIQSHMPTVRVFELFEKYKEAISVFYQRRYRPPGKRMLVPTLIGCGITVVHGDANLSADNLISFTSGQLVRVD